MKTNQWHTGYTSRFPDQLYVGLIWLLHVGELLRVL